MRFKYLFFLLLFCFSFRSEAQFLQLIDEETNFPIPNVLVYNEGMSISVLTNDNGYAAISAFPNDSIVYIQHPSYHTSVVRINHDPAYGNTIVALKAKKIELGEVVISASKNYELKKLVPRRITSISESEIHFSAPQSSADVLESNGEVFVQRSQMGGGSPMIRGFSANRILLVYDGIRMNNAISRGGNLHNIISADPLFMERIEVLYGPGTVNYGSDALGGVVDMQSKEIFLGFKDFFADASLNFSSANMGRVLHAEAGESRKKFGWYASASFSQFEDLRMGRNTLSNNYLRPFYVDGEDGKNDIVENDDELIQMPSAYSQFSTALKLKYAIKPQKEIEFFANYSRTSDIPRYDRLTELDQDGLPKNSEWFYGPQSWLLTGIRYSDKTSRRLSDLIKITASAQIWEESRNSRRFMDSIRNERTEQVNVFGFDVDMTKNINERSSLQYGLSSYFNQVESKAEGINVIGGENTDISTRYPNGGSTLWLSGLYASYKQKFGKRLNTTFGFRYTYQMLDSRYDDDTPGQALFNEIQLNTGALTASAGATYFLSSKSLLKANINSGFRAPNVDDIAKLFDSEPGFVMVPNPTLDAEYSYNAEIGYEISDSSVYSFNISGFYTYLDNAIVRDDYLLNGQDSIFYEGEKRKVQSLVNGEYANIYGFHIGFMLAFTKDLRFKVNYTHTEGRDNKDRPLRHVSPNFGGIHLIFQKKKLMMDLYSRYNFGFENEEIASSEQSKTHMYALDGNGNVYVPAFMTLNFMANYRMNKTFEFTGGVENITDVGYRTYSSGISAPGINFKLGIKSHF